MNDAATDPRQAVFDALFRAHFAELAAFTYRFVRSRAVAEELVQDLFLAVWERGSADPPFLAPGAVTRSYLFSAARNRAVSWLRRERVQLAWADRESLRAPHVEPGDAAQVVEGEELEAAVARAIETLPERCRLVFQLNRQHGMSYAEVAEALGVTVKAVEANMGRALVGLRRSLAPFLVAAIGMLTGH